MPRSKLEDTNDFIDLFEYLGGDWIVPPQFMRWTAMSLIAACVEDRVSYSIIEHAPLYPNMWVFLIGGSGAGKDVSVGTALRLIEPEDPIWKIDGKVTMPALYDYMHKQQRITQRESAPVYLISSDITEQLPLGPEAKDFTSRALALYGGRNRELLDLTRTNGDKVVKRPVLNWLAGCTKEWFPQAIDPLVFNSGFAGRAFFILGEQVIDNYHKVGPTKRHDYDLVLEYLRGRVQAYQAVEGIFLMNDSAATLYHQWLVLQQERIRSTSLTDVDKVVMTRARMSVLKLAMIYALSRWEPGQLLVIKGGHMSRAISTIQDVTAGVVLVGDFAYVTADTAAIDKVREIVRSEGSIQRQSLLRQAMRRGVKGAKQLDEIVDSLTQSGEIATEKRKPVKPGGRWPHYVVWKPRKIKLGGIDETGVSETPELSSEEATLFGLLGMLKNVEGK